MSVIINKYACSYTGRAKSPTTPVVMCSVICFFNAVFMNVSLMDLGCRLCRDHGGTDADVLDT